MFVFLSDRLLVSRDTAHAPRLRLESAETAEVRDCDQSHNRKKHSRRAWSRDACLWRSSKVKDNTLVENKGYYLMKRKVQGFNVRFKSRLNQLSLSQQKYMGTYSTRIIRN